MHRIGQADNKMHDREHAEAGNRDPEGTGNVRLSFHITLRFTSVIKEGTTFKPWYETFYEYSLIMHRV